MPDLRKDPIVGRWVIIAKSRAKRPHDFRRDAAASQAAASARSAKGNEDKTPGEIVAYREPGTQRNRAGLARARRAQQVSRPWRSKAI